MSKLRESVAETLAEWIASARYPIHSRLPAERDLVKMLGVSRGTLRDALEQLESEGIVWRQVGIGTYVGSRPASIVGSLQVLSVSTTLAEILEARLSFEPIVARFAAVRAQDQELAMMSKYLADGCEAQTWGDWEKWDELFHRAVTEASGNGILIKTIDQIFRIKTHARWTVKTTSEFDPRLVRRYSREHEKVLEAIKSRDPDSAEQAMKAHIKALTLTIGPVIARGH
ncbi:FadR/GntR family transcriptional regulator [Neorhizobium sp. CSC1952]|uniref:FadR/GntR family transcriptional regulator n=1 Tax=Neorhizobium sp. CSC1952 TaxID=2978974 RepID=UPI0025A5C562|nr:FadR/GntR family transcriptional regulator [Rhizobium sp. CSC1952]WJR65837.1 FadR/GntR family transcriptional regulator [Rhizobium sp. CSC1952]